jgi:hypothetical protein
MSLYTIEPVHHDRSLPDAIRREEGTDTDQMPFGKKFFTVTLADKQRYVHGSAEPQREFGCLFVPLQIHSCGSPPALRMHSSTSTDTTTACPDPKSGFLCIDK